MTLIHTGTDWLVKFKERCFQQTLAVVSSWCWIEHVYNSTQLAILLYNVILGEREVREKRGVIL